MTLETVSFNFEQQVDSTKQRMTVTIDNDMHGLHINIKTSDWYIRDLKEFTEAITKAQELVSNQEF